MRLAAVYVVLNTNNQILFIEKPALGDDYPWSGQIAFPGGLIEPEDKTHLNAALREVKEEVGIDAHRLNTIGRLGAFPTIRNVMIETYYGVLNKETELIPQKDEVAAIIWQDLDYLRSIHLARGYNNCEVSVAELNYPIHYNNQTKNVWGATARILQYFLDLA